MNHIIKIQVNENGSRSSLQTWQESEIPEGFALCPEEFISGFTAAKGFVNIEIENGAVTAMTENAEAKTAWETQPQPTPEPTTEETLLELAADHEYRLCMQELGLN